MPPQVVFTILFAIALPVGWLVAEFQTRRWPRIVLGILSLSMSIFIALLVGSLSQLNYNAWYGEASAKLMDTIIGELEEGRTDQLLPGLRHLRSEFYPTYQSRANYDQIVERFAQEVRSVRSAEK